MARRDLDDGDDRPLKTKRRGVPLWLILIAVAVPVVGVAAATVGGIVYWKFGSKSDTVRTEADYKKWLSSITYDQYKAAHAGKPYFFLSGQGQVAVAHRGVCKDASGKVQPATIVFFGPDGKAMIENGEPRLKHIEIYTPEQYQAVLEREEFQKGLIGRSEAEVISLIGKPRETSGNGITGLWIYDGKTTDKITGNQDRRAYLHFNNGYCDSISF